MVLHRRSARALPKAGLAVFVASAALWLLYRPSPPSLPWYERAYRQAEETFIYSDELMSAVLDPHQLERVRRRMPADAAAARNAVVLLKTHKTGSSTLQNILFRYGLLRNLSFALPQGDRASFYWPIEFHRRFVMRQRGVSEFHIVGHHMVYSDDVSRVAPPGAALVTIVRDPVDVFRSAYEYFGLERLCYGASLEEFYTSAAYEPLRSQKCAALRMPARNFMAVDFGLPLGQMDNDSAVRELIRRVEGAFELVLVNEQFELSLAVLRRALGWRLSDVVALPQNARVGRRRASGRLAAEILKYNRADALIYDHFAANFRNRVLTRYDRRTLERDADALRNLTRLWRERCVERTAPAPLLADRAFRPYGRGTSGYVLRPHMTANVMCRLLTLPELALTRWIKHRAIENNRRSSAPYFPPA